MRHPTTHARPSISDISEIADIFNSSVVSYAINAAWESGVTDRLEEQGRLVARSFAEEQSLSAELISSILQTLAIADIVRFDPERGEAFPGPIFEQAGFASPLFHWLHGGCGSLLHQLADIARGQTEGIERNATAISVASAEANARYFDPVFHEMLNSIDFSVVADLGAGSGRRLIDAVGRTPGSRGVGLEIAPSSVELAQTRIAESGLDDRIELLERDVTKLAFERAYADVDLVTCFLMGHDLWPRHKAVDVLRGLRTTFPRVHTLVLCDTVRLTGDASRRSDSIFSIGFELVHAAMGVYIPTTTEWLDVFEESGWKCDAHEAFEVPSSTVLFRLTTGAPGV